MIRIRRHRVTRGPEGPSRLPARRGHRIAWDFGDASGDVFTDSTRCIVRIRGRGDALDVRVHGVSADGTLWPYAVGKAAVVPFGGAVELWFSLTPPTTPTTK